MAGKASGPQRPPGEGERMPFYAAITDVATLLQKIRFRKDKRSD
jgi:hypothetical protein